MVKTWYVAGGTVLSSRQLSVSGVLDFKQPSSLFCFFNVLWRLETDQKTQICLLLASFPYPVRESNISAMAVRHAELYSFCFAACFLLGFWFLAAEIDSVYSVNTADSFCLFLLHMLFSVLLRICSWCPGKKTTVNVMAFQWWLTLLTWLWMLSASIPQEWK